MSERLEVESWLSFTSTFTSLTAFSLFGIFQCCDSIERLYLRNCEETSGEYHSVRLLAIMLVMLVCTMIKAFMKRGHVGWLPDACAFILVGTFVGGVLRLFDSTFVGSRLSFDNDLFLQIMLPPIIFQAALAIDKRAFRRDLFPILAFAGFGTAFSAIAIGWITHQVSQWGNQGHLPLLDSLVFGSLIASIDPVATLSILAGVGVSQTDTLYTLIFGESLLNDGVAIVLFDTLKSYLGGEDGVELTASAYQEMAQHFAGVLFGSIGIGLGVGICCTLYFYGLRGQQTAVTEVAIFFCWALIPYYIAEATGCSGIIAIMVMGFFMDYFVVGGFQSEETSWMDYMATRTEDEHGVAVQPQQDRWEELQAALYRAFSGRGHILSRSRNHVGFVAHVISEIMETAIFAYLGLFLFSDNVWDLRLNLTAILSCVTSRAIMVVGLSFLINTAVFFDVENRILKCFRGIRQINLADDDDSVGSHTRVYLDRRTQLILLLSGVRGAVSFALVENIPVWDAVTKQGSKYKAELKAMTSSSIVFTLFVFGALTYISVKQGDPNGGGHVAGSTLTHRLMSEPLDSDDENHSENASEMNSLSLEIEHPSRPTGTRQQYQAPNQWTE
jgi:NhaP-type Na+/H+ or K+/H+ antiporter